MGLARGSKQDLSTGVPVESAVNLNGEAGIIQATSYSGGKVDFGIHSRSVSAIDAAVDLSTLTYYDIGNAPAIQLWGVSDTPGSRVSVRPVWKTLDFTDPDHPADVIIGAGDTVELAVSNLKRSSGATYVTDVIPDIVRAGCASKVALLVTFLTTGSSWTIGFRAYS